MERTKLKTPISKKLHHISIKVQRKESIFRLKIMVFSEFETEKIVKDYVKAYNIQLFKTHPPVKLLGYRVLHTFSLPIGKNERDVLLTLTKIEHDWETVPNSYNSMYGYYLVRCPICGATGKQYTHHVLDSSLPGQTFPDRKYGIYCF